MNGTAVPIQNAIGNYFGFKCIMDLVYRAIDVALIFGGIALLAFMVWGGIEWMTSGGDKAHIESAQKRITNALIGVAVIAASFALWKIVLTFFGINAPNICQDKPF